MEKSKIALLVFLTVSFLDIVGILYKIPVLIHIFKPLILLSLITLYALSVSKINKMYVLALICSILGDVFLMFEGELYFIIGLISFLLAHLLFINIVIKEIKKNTIKNIIIAAFPFVIVFSLLIFRLKNSLGGMLFPVIIYGITIATFGTVSLINFREKKSMKSIFMLFGAIIFMISDSVLAINKFYEQAHIFEIIVMATYVLAQYFIYRAMILNKI